MDYAAVAAFAAVITVGFQVVRQVRGVATRSDLDKQSTDLIKNAADTFAIHKQDIARDLKVVVEKLDQIYVEAKATNGRVRSLEDWRLEVKALGSAAKRIRRKN